MRLSWTCLLATLIVAPAACGNFVDPPWDCGPAPLDASCEDPCGFPGTLVCREGSWVCPAASETCEVTSCEDYGHDIGDCYDDRGERYDPTCTPSGEYVCIPPENPRLVVPSFPARWSDGFGGPGAGDVQALAMDVQGNVYVAMNFDNYLLWDDETILQTSAPDIALAKYDPMGEKLWISQIGGDGADYALSLALHPDGTVVLLRGTSSTTNVVSMSVQRVATHDGSLVDELPLGMDVGTNGFIRMVVNETTGNTVFYGLSPDDVTIAGGETLPKAGGLGFVASFDATLSPLWGRRLPMEYAGFFADVDTSGRVFLGGTYVQDKAPSVDGVVFPAAGAEQRYGFVLALGPIQGHALWGRAVLSGRAEVRDIEATEDGGVAFAGYFHREAALGEILLSSPPVVRAPLVGRLGPLGEPIFLETHGLQDFRGEWPAWQLEHLASGELFFAGSTGGQDFVPGQDVEGADNRDKDIMMLRLDGSTGGVVWSDIFGDHRPNHLARLATNGESVAVAGTFAERLDVGHGPIPFLGVDGPSGFVASFDRAAP